MQTVTLGGIAHEAARVAATAPRGSTKQRAAALVSNQLKQGTALRQELEADPVMGGLLRDLNRALR